MHILSYYLLHCSGVEGRFDKKTGWKVSWGKIWSHCEFYWLITFLKIWIFFSPNVFKICVQPPLGQYLYVDINTGFSVKFYFSLSLLTMGWTLRTPSVKHFSIARITLTKESQSPNQRWELQPLFLCAVFFFYASP